MTKVKMDLKNELIKYYGLKAHRRLKQRQRYEGDLNKYRDKTITNEFNK